MEPINLRVWGVEKSVRAFKEISGSTLGGSEGDVISFVWGSVA